MPEINIDLNGVLKNRNTYILLFSGCGAFVCHEKFSCDIANSVLVGMGIFITLNLVLWVKNKLEKQYEVFNKNKTINEKKRKKLEAYLQHAKVLFKSLSNEDRETAINIYNLPRDENDQLYERYVDSHLWHTNFGRLGIFQCDYNYKLIESDNIYSNGTIHLTFDPIFYHLLENYISTKKYCLPTKTKLMSLSKYYFIN